MREDGLLRNRHEAILGADNKAAVATILATARRLVAQGSPVGVEILFTTSEELALRGAKAFAADTLRSEFGYVFDHASPIGEVVLASPTYYRLEARFLGRAAHAGIRPEDGHNAIAAAASAIAAMTIGRLDPETTANVGRDRGGHLGERGGRALHGRARGPQPGRGSGGRGDRHHGGCGHGGGERRASATWRPTWSGSSGDFAWPAPLRRWRWPQRRSAACGFEPSYISTGGGSDANALVAGGLPVVNLANGTERNHQPDESVTVEALEQMLDVTLALVAAAAGDAAMTAFERIGGRVVFEGKLATVRIDSFRYEDGAEAEREMVMHPGAVAMVALDADAFYMVRQPREAVGEEGLLELPAGKLDPGEDPLTTGKRELAEEIGGRPGVAAPHELLHLARLHGRGVPRLPGRGPVRGAGRLRRGRAHRDRAHPARRARGDDRAMSRLQEPRRAPLAARPPHLTPTLQVKGWGPPGRTRPPMATIENRLGSDAPTERFEQLVLDFLAYLEFERGLSRNTLEAYRSDLLQYGRFLAGRRRVRPRGRAAPTWRTSSPRWPPARRRAARLAGHHPPQDRLPALLLPPPAPGRAARIRSHVGPQRAAPEPQAARTCSRAARWSSLLAQPPRHRARRAAATAPCSS